MVAALAAIASFVWLSFREDDGPAASPDLRDATAEAPATTPPLQAPLARETRSSSDVLEEATSEESPAAANGPETAAASPDDYLIEVLDHQGAPVRDAEVQVRLQILGVADLSSSDCGTYRCEPAPAPPVIRLPRANLLRNLEHARQQTRSYGSARGFELSIGLRDPLAPCDRRRMTGAEDEERKIVLRLGPTARVRIEAYDAAGTALERKLRFVLRRPGSSRSSPTDRLIASATTGFHVFSMVPLGASIEAGVEDRSGALIETYVRIESPAIAGEELVVPVRLDREAPRICGRLLDAEGSPLPNTSFMIVSHRYGSSWQSGGETDPGGRFSIYLDIQHRGFGQPEALSFTANLARSGEERPAEVRIPAPPYPEVGILDLGDLRVAEPSRKSLLAAGIVVDTEGHPMENVGISLWDVWPPRQEGPWDDWRALNEESFETNAEGRFEIRTHEKVRALRIAPSKDGYYPETRLTVDPGTADLRLVMGRAHRFSGRVLLPAGAAQQLCYVVPHDGKRFRNYVRLREDGAFETEALKPGGYRFDVVLDGFVLRSVPEVQVGDPAMPSDSRLDPLDLRGALRRWSLRVLDPSGEPWLSNPVHVLPTSARSSAATRTPEEGGRVRFWLPSEDAHLRLFAEGMQPVSVSWSEGEHIVQLTAASSYRILLAGLGEVPPEASVSVSFVPPPGDAADADDLIRALSVAAASKVHDGMILERKIALPGQTFVLFQVRSVVADEYVELPPVALDIPEVPTAEPLRVAPAPGTLENALAELRRRAQR